MEFGSQKFEREEAKEKMPFEADLRVDFIRHGKPSYTVEERRAGQFEGELTGEGRRQIENQALELAQGIDKEKELVVIWKSPKKRASQTSDILKEIFEKEGISIWEEKTKESLRDLKLTSESVDFFKQFVKKENATDGWMKYWSEAEKLPQGMEKPEDIKKRIERLMVYLERIARVVWPIGNKKLHFVCVGHEEVVRDLLEEAFNTGTKKGTGPTYGEVLRVDVKKSALEKDAALDLSYRGLKAELGFSPEQRKFYKNAD